jgi:hypothetical protein
MVFRACDLLLGRETDGGDDGGVSATASCQLQGRAKFIYASRYGSQVDAGRLTTLRQGKPPYCHHLLQG